MIGNCVYVWFPMLRLFCVGCVFWFCWVLVWYCGFGVEYFVIWLVFVACCGWDWFRLLAGLCIVCGVSSNC